jgi:hypothetical protein
VYVKQKSLNLQWLYDPVHGFANHGLRFGDICIAVAIVVLHGSTWALWDKISGGAFASTPSPNLMLRIGRREGDLDR